MKTESGARMLHLLPSHGPGWRTLAKPIGRFPQRLREKRFWYVQVLVLAATAPHYTLESLGLGESKVLYGLAITAYIVPLIYAALAYGWEGAILTGLWAAFLTSTSMWVWHHPLVHWLGELAQLAIVLPAGVVMAWRVDLEARLRLRAERTSESLRLLNEIGEILSRNPEVEQQLPQVLHCLLQHLSLESAWLCLEPGSRGVGRRPMIEATSLGVPSPAELAWALHQRLGSTQVRCVTDGQAFALPLLSEVGVMGSLGVKFGADDSVGVEQVDLLTTVAHQVQVGVENARLYGGLAELNQARTQLLAKLISAQEEERQRIARELHDETGQALTGIIMSLEAARASPNPEATKSRLDKAESLASDSIEAIRRLVVDLRPAALDDLGLVPALSGFAESHLGEKGVRLEMTVSGLEERLPGPVETCLFRVVQEAIINIVRYAEAQSARIELRGEEDVVYLTVEDDGRGFDTAEVANSPDPGRALGLAGMQERISLIGGRLKLTSTPGHGTTIEAQIPLSR